VANGFELGGGQLRVLIASVVCITMRSRTWALP